MKLKNTLQEKNITKDNMKQPKYTRGSYKSHPLKQWSVRVHDHEKPLVKQFLKELRCETTTK